jgi:hypothetical protein
MERREQSMSERIGELKEQLSDACLDENVGVLIVTAPREGEGGGYSVSAPGMMDKLLKALLFAMRELWEHNGNCRFDALDADVDLCDPDGATSVTQNSD